MFKTFVAASLLTIPLTVLTVVLFSFTFVFALNPSFASAQTDPPEDQSLDSTVYCPNITQTLVRGDCDAGLNRDWCLRYVPNKQVTELQHFLSDYYDIEPEDIMTGYFGNLTKRKVRDFQREQGLPSFGIVGLLTRARIASVCGTQPPPNPIPAPTCSLNAIPSSITLGQPAFLVWTSTNASSATITNLGSVLTTGAQQVSPTQTTVYSGTFTGLGGSTTCTATITVTPSTGNASCTLDGVTVQHTQPRVFYSSRTHANCSSVAQTRTCTNGTLDGSATYQYASCTPADDGDSHTPPIVSLLINGQSAVTLPPGQTFTAAWSSSNATTCNLTNNLGQTNPTPPNTSASNQGAAPSAGTTWTYTLSCTNAGGTTTKTASVTGQTTTGGGGTTGALNATPTSGAAPIFVKFKASLPVSSPGPSYKLQSGEGTTITFNPSPYNCTGTCNFEGEYSYNIPGSYTAKLEKHDLPGDSSPTVIGTADISAGAIPVAGVGACTYKGRQYPEDTNLMTSCTSTSPYNPCKNYRVQCDNSAWVSATTTGPIALGTNACDKAVTNLYNPQPMQELLDLSCVPYTAPERKLLSVIKRHGKVPLTVTAYAGKWGDGYCNDTFSWGDGNSEAPGPCNESGSGARMGPYTHTYSTPGNYVIRFTSGASHYTAPNTANVRVE